MQKLKQILIDKNISAKDLASQLNISEVNISRYLNNKRKMSVVILYRISKLLNVSMEDLIDDRISI